jgi:PAS domain S-box-containing protein
MIVGNVMIFENPDLLPFLDALKCFFDGRLTDPFPAHATFHQAVSAYLGEIAARTLGVMVHMAPDAPADISVLPAAFSESISATVGFAGMYSGAVSIHCPLTVAGLIAGHMMGTDGSCEYESIHDAMGELANVLAGDIKQSLSRGGLDIQLSTPSVISGAHYLLSAANHHQNITVLLTVAGEPVYVSLVAERNRLLQLAAEELKTKKEWLSLALDGGNLGLWSWDLASGSVDFSEEWARLLGYDVADLLPGIATWEALTHPDDMPNVMAALRCHLAGRCTSFEAEHRLLNKQGQWRWFLTKGRIVARTPDQRAAVIAGTHLDIHDRKQTELALAASNRIIVDNEKRLRCITDSAHDAIVMMDANGTITFWNPAAENILGYSADEACGRDLHELIAPGRYRDAWRAARPEFSRSGYGAAVGTTLELSALHKHGQELVVSLSLSAVSLDGAWHAVGVLRDISELKRYEAALKQLNEQLEQRVAEELRKNREKDGLLLHQEKLASIGQLAAGVAHEINNPIGFIMGNLNTMRSYAASLVSYCRLVDGQLSADIRSALHASREQCDLDYILSDLQPLLNESLEGAERVRRIVLDLKDFARSDDREPQQADLNHLIRSTINIVRNEVKYVAELDLQLGELPSILCHPQQINQVISNLLVNAAHAIEHQGTITVRSWHDGDHVLFSVSDTGKGIPHENIQRIFDPFFTTKDVGKGTGLGLSISYDIISKRDGQITVDSEVGKGTVFTVKLPVTGSNKVLK